jgi:hypothetical protein
MRYVNFIKELFIACYLSDRSTIETKMHLLGDCKVFLALSFSASLYLKKNLKHISKH